MIKQPRLVGSIAPSSTRLANLIAREALSVIEKSGGLVVEIGPGTGCITRALLAHGVASENLVCVELDPVLHQYMTEQFPEIHTILGDAADVETLLSGRCTEVAVVVSGVPLKNLPLNKADVIIHSCCDMLKPYGKFIQFTYGISPPAITPKLTISRKFVGFVLLNLPPAFVWSFTKME
eukprot:CAMPEP_0116830826 /NCGR_PEP_ID=MMETSP0418-20121206/4982_1 /TAXON_ID=1158023 /ORGANISM="Astrosyne radiata, Strain 13vi08-1A" /LENGTH=178 /DNA_ID=CAMNT_0004459979 /DNA_START=1679 /DNA_END=2215 /DNA_ORIENTATION=+